MADPPSCRGRAYLPGDLNVTVCAVWTRPRLTRSIPAGEDHLGPLSACSSCRLELAAGGPADHDDGLPEQLRFALGGSAGGCGAHDSSGSVLFGQQFRLRFSLRMENPLY